jgi:hypothetical protein
MRTRLTVMVIGIATLVGILLLSLPDADDIPEEKMTSISMAMCLADIKIDIRKHIEQGKSPLSAYENPCPELVNELNVTTTGTIEARNSKQGIRLTFVPVNNNGRVRWSCSGTPVQFVPRACQKASKQ